MGVFASAAASTLPTARYRKGDEGRLLTAGCDGYLSKPILVATFAAEVSAFLDPVRPVS